VPIHFPNQSGIGIETLLAKTGLNAVTHDPPKSIGPSQPALGHSGSKVSGRMQVDIEPPN